MAGMNGFIDNVSDIVMLLALWLLFLIIVVGVPQWLADRSGESEAKNSKNIFANGVKKR